MKLALKFWYYVMCQVTTLFAAGKELSNFSLASKFLKISHAKSPDAV